MPKFIYISGGCPILASSYFLIWNIIPKHRKSGNMALYWVKNMFAIGIPPN